MKGTYTLIIELSEDSTIRIGALGEIDFKEGVYVYVGSGLNNLEKRIKRHLREEKNMYWHIDYFLNEAEVEEVWFAKNKNRKECDIAKGLADKFSFIDKFGSSDCKCKSHLIYSTNISKIRKSIIKSFKKDGLKPRRW